MRFVLAVAVLIVVGALVLDMSSHAPRLAGTDHTSPVALSVTVPGGGVLCQPELDLPEDVGYVDIVLGTYGRPLPPLHIRFFGTRDQRVAQGSLAQGGREGQVRIPLRESRNLRVSRFCLSVGGRHSVALGGEAGAIGSGSAIVNHHKQPGRISIVFMRPGRESWWDLLSVLAERFGVGKSPYFGAWTLPVVALLLLVVWAATLRLVLHEGGRSR